MLWFFWVFCGILKIENALENAEMYVRVTGSFRKRNLKVGKVRFGKKGPEELKRIIHNLAPHNYHQIPGWIVVERGKEDCTLIWRRETPRGIEEKGMIDFQAMYSVHNFGYNLKGPHGRIKRDFIDYLQDPHAPPPLPRAVDHEYHPPALQALIGFTKLDQVIMKSGGAETVETAYSTAKQFFWDEEHGETVKRAAGIALKSWRRKHKGVIQNEEPIIIVPLNNFHGRTHGPRSFSSDPKARNGFDPLLGNVYHVNYGDLNDLEAALHLFKDRVIALLLEPVQGEGGVIVPSPEYLPGAEDLCQKYETLLILDEIQTGYGRTGTDLAYERYGVKPDLVCLGKAMGGGILPVSCVVGKEDVMRCIKPGTEGATWSATPAQCVVAVAAIRELSNCKLSEQSEKKGVYFLEKLKRLKNSFPESITDVRGQGLFVGVDTIFDGQEVSLMLLEEGIWAKETGQTGKTIRFSPPLTITLRQLQKGVDALGNVIEKLQKRLKKIR